MKAPRGNIFADNDQKTSLAISVPRYTVHMDLVTINEKTFDQNISSLTTIDIPNQINCIKGQDLKKKLSNYPNVKYKTSIQEAIKSIDLLETDIVMITGSLYLAGEVLNLN